MEENENFFTSRLNRDAVTFERINFLQAMVCVFVQVKFSGGFVGELGYVHCGENFKSFFRKKDKKIEMEKILICKNLTVFMII